MALPATIIQNTYSGFSPNFDLSVSGNTIGIPAAGNQFTLLTVSGLTGKGAVLTLEGTADANGTTWTAVSAMHTISQVIGSAISVDGNYKVASGSYTMFRWRVSTIGTGVATVANGGGSQPLDVAVVSSITSTSTPGATPGSPSYVQVVSGGAASSATFTPAAVAYAAGTAGESGFRLPLGRVSWGMGVRWWFMIRQPRNLERSPATRPPCAANAPNALSATRGCLLPSNCRR